MTEQQHEALLKTIRRDIDKADKEIVNAIDQRLQAVKRVAQVKRLQGLPVYDAVREASLLYKLRSITTGETTEVTLPVYRTLMAAARRFEETESKAEEALSGHLTLTLTEVSQFTEVMAIFTVHNYVPERMTWEAPVIVLEALKPLPASLVRDLREHGIQIEGD